jgi:hypothetical protein
VLTVMLALGLYLLVGRFVIDARQRRRTCYVVSSERVIIAVVSGLHRRVVRSLNLDTLSDVTLAERRGGSGTITFGPLPPYWAWYAGHDWTAGSGQGIPQLELPSQARRVYDVILAARRALRSAASSHRLG